MWLSSKASFSISLKTLSDVIWPQYTEAQFWQGDLEGNQEQLEEPDPGGRRAEGPESQPGGRLRGAKRDILEGSPEEASCGQQGRRPHRRAPDLSGGARGTRAAPRGVRGTGPRRQSSRDRIGSEQREGEALCTEDPLSVRTAPEGKRVDDGVASKKLRASQGGAQEAGGSNSAGCT